MPRKRRRALPPHPLPLATEASPATSTLTRSGTTSLLCARSKLKSTPAAFTQGSRHRQRRRRRSRRGRRATSPALGLHTAMRAQAHHPAHYLHAARRRPRAPVLEPLTTPFTSHVPRAARSRQALPPPPPPPPTPPPPPPLAALSPTDGRGSLTQHIGSARPASPSPNEAGTAPALAATAPSALVSLERTATLSS